MEEFLFVDEEEEEEEEGKEGEELGLKSLRKEKRAVECLPEKEED